MECEVVLTIPSKIYSKKTLDRILIKFLNRILIKIHQISGYSLSSDPQVKTENGVVDQVLSHYHKPKL